jgi:hypothetical protein
MRDGVVLRVQAQHGSTVAWRVGWAEGGVRICRQAGENSLQSARDGAAPQRRMACVCMARCDCICSWRNGCTHVCQSASQLVKCAYLLGCMLQLLAEWGLPTAMQVEWLLLMICHELQSAERQALHTATGFRLLALLGGSQR